MSSHAVYRIFSEAGAPLYVGTTSRDWWVRVAEQAAQHPEIANTAGRVEVTHHATREAAFEVESAEIKRLAPRINTRCKFHESRAFTGGDLTRLIVETIKDLGTATSAGLIAHLPQVGASSVRTTVMRLRRAGTVETVCMARASSGRPMHVVALSGERTAA